MTRKLKEEYEKYQLLMNIEKKFQVHYPFPSTDLHQKQQILSTLQMRAVCRKLFDSV